MGNQPTTQSTTENTGPWFSYLHEIHSSQKSQITPYYKSQITYLQRLFHQLDKKNTKSLTLLDLITIPFISEHPLQQRILQLFQQQLVKIKTKKISLQIFLHLLTTFHIETEVEQKCKFLFRMYDWDKDFKITHHDLCLTFAMLFREKIVGDRMITEEAVKNIASQALSRYGTRGEIKLEQFVDLLPGDEVREMMTWRFLKESE